MNFTVCIKQVPDVSAPIRISEGKLVFDTGRMVLNAYDASAVEESLVLTEAHGGEVNLLCIGPDRAKETIRKALAMGAHKAQHIVLGEDADLNSRAYTDLLARHLEEADYDVIACGKQAQDSDAGLTGSMLAERLGLPYTTNAVRLAIEGDKLIVTRQGDTGQELIELPTPCLVTCSNDMNNPRIPSIKGIMQAKRKTIEAAPAADVPTPATRILAFEPFPEREAGLRLEGEVSEIVTDLVDRLANEAKVL